ncbi:helix-turn-helix domain-containing protein [Yinghuangia soli]|uniref:Helix-turn-helix domain-containing protein n=1 Tax=Yinghuangia soli TaxID=2908204 RepID=A0AA41U3B0_9ACTN|nr:helix-turn-helix domain-containing protein [Yinghuangia soli]MCF2531601.1 helix-turn-helix domain-containing protein [Yinghuangia soli]
MSRPSPQTDRLIALVDLLAARPDTDFTLAEIARGLGVGKATVHPMLTTLTRAGWLLRHPVRRTYRLGPAIVAAGRAAATGETPLDLVRPVMRTLAAETGLGVLALVPCGDAADEDDLRVGELVRLGGTGNGTLTGALGVRLGDRVRPRPPLGSVTVAWAGAAAVDAWLGRLDPDGQSGAAAPAPAVRAGSGVPGGRPYVRTPAPESAAVSAARRQLAPALAGVRERGWALETEDRLRDRLGALVRDLEIELGTGDWDAAGHAAALRRAMAEVGQAFDLADALPASIEPDALYRASSVNAPVFDADGTVAVVLCLIDHAAPLTGREVAALGERVRAAAADVTAALHGRVPDADDL